MLAALILALLAGVLPQGTDTTPAAGRIEGQVLISGTATPLADVRVSLESIGSRNPVRIATTDSAGRFSFGPLESGLYGLVLEHETYLVESLESLVAGDGPLAGTSRGPTTPSTGRLGVQLEGEQSRNYRFRMAPRTLVRGRILDSDGRAAASAEVQLLVREFYDEITGLRNGLENAPGTTAVQTDADGLYSFDGVRPGRYYLRASAGAGAGASVRTNAFGDPRESAASDPMSASYYPGFADPADASPIEVAAGSDLRFDFRLQPPSGLRVAGEIANDLGYPAGSGNYEFTLISRQGGRTRLFGPLPDRTPEPETFEFTNVREGRYELLVVYLPVTGDGRRWQPYLGRATVEISDEDVTGLQVFMEPNTSIEGRILLDPSARERVPDVAALLPMLTLEEAMPRDLSLNPMIQRLRPVRADGTFTIPDAFPLTYRLSVMQHTLPPGVYLSAARLGPDNVLGVPFRVDPSTTGPLVLEVRGDGARLTGRVVSGPDPAADARIVLVPGGYWREEPTAYRTTRTGFDGRFAVEGIRPGAYTVYAFEDIPYGAWLDDLFMAPWLSRGVSVSLTPSESLERTLTLIQNGP